MPLNLIKSYADFLEIGYMSENQRNTSLRNIFNRDIQDNHGFSFQDKPIRPIKTDGQVDMEVLYNHLTTREDKDEKGRGLKSRSFENGRSIRLHWIRHHIEQRTPANIKIFSYIDRVLGKDIIRTYIFDETNEYVVILEPQRSGMDYYLLTAYHLSEVGSLKQMRKKLQNKLPVVH